MVSNREFAKTCALVVVGALVAQALLFFLGLPAAVLVLVALAATWLAGIIGLSALEKRRDS